MMRWRLWGAAVLWSMALGLWAAGTTASAQTFDQPRTPPLIEVLGEAEVTADPDVAYFDVAVVVKNPAPQPAMDQMSQRMERVMAALREKGVARDQMKTLHLTLNEYMEPKPRPEPVEEGRPRPQEFERGYQAVHRLQVKLNEDQFQRIGEMLTAAIDAGANEVGAVRFGIKDEAALHARGLESAVRSARAKAESLARGAGISLGRVYRISEIMPPRPFAGDRMEMATLRAGGAQPVPPSEITRQVTVTVQYLIGE